MSEAIPSETSSTGSEVPKTPSRQKLYNMLSTHVEEAITYLLDLMRNSRNDSIKMGAINTILNKCLPDIKAVELTGENQEPIRVRIVIDNGTLPTNSRPTNTELPEAAVDIRPQGEV